MKLLTHAADRFGLAVLILWLSVMAAVLSRAWHADMAGIYVAGRLFHQGRFELIYPELTALVSGTPALWEPLLVELGHGGETAFPFIYPPLWAAVAAPLAGRVDPETFMTLIYVVQTWLYAGMVWFAYLLYRSAENAAGAEVMNLNRWSALSIVAGVLAVPSLFALLLGQPQITVTALVMTSALLLSRGRPGVAGAVMGLAAALKLTPFAFLFIFVVLGKWRGAAVMIATTAALAGLSFWLCGAELNRQFAEQARTVAGNVYAARLTYNLAPALLELMPGQRGQVLYDISFGGYAARAPAWLAVVTYGSLGTMLAAVWVMTRTLSEPRRLVALLVTTTVAVAASGPLGWAHYYIIPVLFLPVLCAPRFSAGARVLFVITVLVLSAPVVLGAPFVLAILGPLAVLIAIALWFLRVWPRQAV